MKSLVYKVVVFGFALLVSCESDTIKDDNINLEASKEDEAKTITNQYDEIHMILNGYTCTNASDWDFMPIGSKACGGPEGFIAYPKKDSESFVSKVEEYTKSRKAFDLKWGAISDCSLASFPREVICVDAKPELVY